MAVNWLGLPYAFLIDVFDSISITTLPWLCASFDHAHIVRVVDEFFALFFGRNWGSGFHIWSPHCTCNRSKVCAFEETKEITWYVLTTSILCAFRRFLFLKHYWFYETLDACHGAFLLPIRIWVNVWNALQ